MDALIEMPGKGVARPSSPKASFALINTTFTRFAQALTVADRCTNEFHTGGDMNFLSQVETIRPDLLADAKPIHARMLANYANARVASYELSHVLLLPKVRITQPAALKMLSALFGALSTKKSDDSDGNPVMRLMACADMFDATSEIVGNATDLWQPVSKHPLVLALAIKRLLATQVFAPSPSEVREAMELVHQRLKMKEHWTRQWRIAVERADEIVFALDRAAWDAAYAHVSSDVVLAMRESVEYDGEGPGEDDDGNQYPPSPHWQALDDLLKAKTPTPKRVAAARKRSEVKRRAGRKRKAKPRGKRAKGEKQVPSAENLPDGQGERLGLQETRENAQRERPHQSRRLDEDEIQRLGWGGYGIENGVCRSFSEDDSDAGNI